MGEVHETFTQANRTTRFKHVIVVIMLTEMTGAMKYMTVYLSDNSKKYDIICLPEMDSITHAFKKFHDILKEMRNAGQTFFHLPWECEIAGVY